MPGVHSRQPPPSSRRSQVAHLPRSWPHAPPPSAGAALSTTHDVSCLGSPNVVKDQQNTYACESISKEGGAMIVSC